MTGKQPTPGLVYASLAVGGERVPWVGVGAVMCAYRPWDHPALRPYHPPEGGWHPLLPEGTQCGDRHPMPGSRVGMGDDGG